MPASTLNSAAGGSHGAPSTLQAGSDCIKAGGAPSQLQGRGDCIEPSYGGGTTSDSSDTAGSLRENFNSGGIGGPKRQRICYEIRPTETGSIEGTGAQSPPR